ncbi:acid-sensing ion channel 4-A-like isoform X1 [Haliotis rufescens]|uniref:acid-sensing ion channel 4-A-like isoform X1 n=2 Tax=Haliotis rufescens TaxID=6454 RepID=UPI00201F7998|nr:acid-sensing ion channel 4-A-like isoform X1 [Haliotis rufescens]
MDTRFCLTSTDGMTGTEKTGAEGPPPKYTLCSLWTEFSLTTGIHGFNKISPSGRISYRGLLWILAISGATAFLIYNLVKEFGDYYSYPTATKVTNKVQSSIEFPAVTICNRCPLNKTRLNVNPHIESYFQTSSLLKRFNKQGTFNFTDSRYSDLRQPLSLDWWTNMSMDGSSLLHECYFGGDNIDCATHFQPVFTDEGLCHTFNFNVSDIVNVNNAGNAANFIIIYNIAQRYYTYRENMAAGIKVLLHNPRHHPDANPTVVMAAPGFSTYVAMHKSEYVYLPDPYMAFDDTTCVDTTSTTFVNPLKHYSPYTYDHCFMECVQIKAFNVCGCVGPADPQPDVPICSLEKQDTCYTAFVREMTKNITFEAECGCGIQCRFETFTAQVSSSVFPADIWSASLLNTTKAENSEFLRNNFLELRVFYDRMMVTSTKQHPQYSQSTLFSNVGGQMGLCLGASILTITEITELLVFIIFYLCDRCRGRKARNRINNW